MKDRANGLPLLVRNNFMVTLAVQNFIIWKKKKRVESRIYLPVFKRFFERKKRFRCFAVRIGRFTS